MSTTQRSALMDTPLFVFLGMMWGLVGGAVAGALLGLVVTVREAVTDGWNHAETFLPALSLAGGFAGMTLGAPTGLACGVVVTAYVLVRRAVLRHAPVAIARGFALVALVITGVAAIWLYVGTHGGRGPNLDFDLWVMLPATIAAMVTGWYAARNVARSYLRANGYQNDAIAEVFPRRRTKQRQTVSTEPSTMDE